MNTFLKLFWYTQVLPQREHSFLIGFFFHTLARDDDACLNDVLGGGIVTNICEHRPMEPEKLLGIGDYNSSLRMVKLPKVLYQLSTLSVLYT